MTPFASISEPFFDRLLKLGTLFVVEAIAAASWHKFELGAFGQVGGFVENNATIADPSSKRLHSHHHSITARSELQTIELMALAALSTSAAPRKGPGA